MAKEMKKAGFALCGGVFFVLLGIFLLYLHSRTNILDSPLQCLRRGDFYPINSRNIYILIPFCMIFAGFLTELFGFYKLAKAVNDMKIFYNRLNLYFAVTLFVLLSIKSIMAGSETLFLVRICVSHIMYDGAGGFLGDILVYATAWFLFILSIYFLMKDFIYLKRVFKTILPIVTLTVCILCLFVFFANYILPFMSLKIHRFLENLMSIKVFIPYLIISFIMCMRILKCEIANDAKELSFYNFMVNRKKIFLILFAALFIAVLVSWALESLKLAGILSYVPSTALLFLPMLLFYRALFYKKFRILLIIIGVIAGIILIGFIFNHNNPFYLLLVIGIIPMMFYIFIVPISLAVCTVLKLQQLNFMKTSIALIIASCVLFGCLVFPY
jgi:hypothetical protein